MNYEIVDGILIVPEIKEMILGTETIISPKKTIGKIIDTKEPLKSFDSFGSKLYLLKDIEDLRNSDTSNNNVRFYDVQKIDDNTVLIIVNFLKNTATDNMIKTANEFHQTSIEKLTDLLV